MIMYINVKMYFTNCSNNHVSVENQTLKRPKGFRLLHYFRDLTNK